MTKKLVLTSVLLLFLTGMVFAEIELGFGIAPPLVAQPEEESNYDGFFYKNTAVFHVGYSFWWLFYASYDALILPPYAVAGRTEVFRPGILSLFDVGFRPKIGPFTFMLTTGVNTLYIYKQDEMDDELNKDLGVNLRAGLGLKLSKSFSIAVSGTVDYISFENMVWNMESLFGENGEYEAQIAKESIKNNFLPAIVLNLHF